MNKIDFNSLINELFLWIGSGIFLELATNAVHREFRAKVALSFKTTFKTTLTKT